VSVTFFEIIVNNRDGKIIDGTATQRGGEEIAVKSHTEAQLVLQVLAKIREHNDRIGVQLQGDKKKNSEIKALISDIRSTLLTFDREL
jgi:hypothetical protein